jgi:hypothetical protein
LKSALPKNRKSVCADWRTARFFGRAFFFGIIKGEQPLIRASRPCRAEHAAFASQTGRRLKSPAGAFMASPPPSFSKRLFWFSFGTQKRTYPTQQKGKIEKRK